MERKNGHTLLIGPGLNKEGTNLGGATRSYENLLKYYRKHNISHKEMYTHKVRKFPRPIYLTIQYFRFIWKADIVFMNLSQNGTRFLGPVIYMLSVMLGRKVVLRPFGSALKEIYQKASRIERWVMRSTILKAHILYLQTEELLQFFTPISRNVKQLKTSRRKPEPTLIKNNPVFNKKFVFIGQLKPSKGIDQLCEAIEQLDSTYTVDIYGPLISPVYEHLANAKYYKGPLLKEREVLSTLSQYDVLILPTFYEGEGYPGVIVEAYSLGIPVITTRWKSIPEIVQDGLTGFLVSPQSTNDLVNAITKYDAQSHSQMSKNARESYLRNFQSEEVMQRVITEIEELRGSWKTADSPGRQYV